MDNPYKLTQEQLQQVEDWFSQDLPLRLVKVKVAQLKNIAEDEITAEVDQQLEQAIRTRNPGSTACRATTRARIDKKKEAFAEEIRRAARRSNSMAILMIERMLETLSVDTVQGRDIKVFIESIRIAVKQYEELTEIDVTDTPQTDADEAMAYQRAEASLDEPCHEADIQLLLSFYDENHPPTDNDRKDAAPSTGRAVVARLPCTQDRANRG